MELQEIVNVFNEVLNQDGKDVITAETSFKDCNHWDSMSAFEITEKLHTRFDVRLRGIQVRKCTTILEIFNTING